MAISGTITMFLVVMAYVNMFGDLSLYWVLHKTTRRNDVSAQPFSLLPLQSLKRYCNDKTGDFAPTFAMQKLNYSKGQSILKEVSVCP